jgi:hypothetical protein
MSTFIDKQGVFHNERRRHPHLRAIYDDARGRIDHFFHAATEWANSPIDYLAHRVVHEAYPSLTPHEVKTLVAAIERTYQPQ